MRSQVDEGVAGGTRSGSQPGCWDPNQAHLYAQLVCMSKRAVDPQPTGGRTREPGWGHSQGAGPWPQEREGQSSAGSVPAVCPAGARQQLGRSRVWRASRPGFLLPARPQCLPGDIPAHLLVLAQRLLLAGQARSLLCVRLVRGGDLVGLGPRPAAHLTAGPCGLVDEGAAGALPAHLGTGGW